MLTMEKNLNSASNPYDDALKWFKEKSGTDFFELCDNNEKRKEFYKKENSINKHDDDVQAIYKHTIANHY